MSTTEKQITSNPLYRFRTPDSIRRKTGLAHFTTQRGDVHNEQGIVNIYPGDFSYKPDPTLEIDLAIWEDNDEDQKSIAMYLNMIGKGGYNVAMAEDFIVAERLKLAWKGDGPVDAEGNPTGRLTIAGKSKRAMVLMWRTAEHAEEAEARRLVMSDEVQKSAEEKESEIADRLAPLGATVRVSITDDDGTDKVDLPRNTKKRR